MAKVDLSKIGEILECSVCLEQLDETSKVLPCQHCFCRRCLHNIANTTAQLNCPECRTPVTGAIDELPSNILLVRLLDTLKNIRIEQPSELKSVGNEVAIASASDGNNNAEPGASSVSEAVALYSYKSEDPNVLSFERGEHIKLLDRVDENWFVGQTVNCSSVRALVPANYIRILTDDTDDVAALKAKQAEKASPDTITKDKSGNAKDCLGAQMSPTRKAVALYDFDASNVIISTGVCDEYDEFLSFRKGDSLTLIRRIDTNWFVGAVGAVKNGRMGLCPSSYVLMLEEDNLAQSATTASGSPKGTQKPDAASAASAEPEEPIYMMPSSISVRPVDDEREDEREGPRPLPLPSRTRLAEVHSAAQTGIFSHGAQISKKSVAADSCCSANSRRAHDFECVYSNKAANNVKGGHSDAAEDASTIRKGSTLGAYNQSQSSVRVAFLGGPRSKGGLNEFKASGSSAKDSSKGSREAEVTKESDRPKTPVGFSGGAMVCPANVSLFGAGKTALADINAKLDLTPTARKGEENSKRATDARITVHREDPVHNASNERVFPPPRHDVDTEVRKDIPELSTLTRSETERMPLVSDRMPTQVRARSVEKQDVRCNSHRSNAPCTHRMQLARSEACNHSHAHSHAAVNRLRTQSAREREAAPIGPLDVSRHARSFTHAQPATASCTRALRLADGASTNTMPLTHDAVRARRSGTKSPTAKLWRMLSSGSSRLFESLRTTVKRIGSHRNSMSDMDDDDSFGDAYDDVSFSEDEEEQRFVSPLQGGMNFKETCKRRAAAAQRIPMDLETADPSRMHSRSHARAEDDETGRRNAPCQCANCAWKQRETRLALEVAYSPRLSRVKHSQKMNERSGVRPVCKTATASKHLKSDSAARRASNDNEAARHIRRGVSRSAASTPDSNGMPLMPSSSSQTQNGMMRYATPCTAIRRFAARSDDELSMHVGDVVYVVQVRSDGWCEAVNARTNDVGLCPLVFLEPTESESSDMKF